MVMDARPASVVEFRAKGAVELLGSLDRHDCARCGW